MSKDAGGYIGEAIDKPKKKRAKGQSPTSRTLQELKSLGFDAGVVERYISFTKRRIDLFGIIDIIAVRRDTGIVGVQATSNNGGNHSARRAKALAEPMLRKWLESGARYEIWSWAKQGGHGERKTWKLRREEITLAEVAA